MLGSETVAGLKRVLPTTPTFPSPLAPGIPWEERGVGLDGGTTPIWLGPGPGLGLAQTEAGLDPRFLEERCLETTECPAYVYQKGLCLWL